MPSLCLREAPRLGVVRTGHMRQYRLSSCCDRYREPTLYLSPGGKTGQVQPAFGEPVVPRHMCRRGLLAVCAHAPACEVGKRVGEEVVLPQVGADLGVGFGPCRFQRAAGLCVSEEKIGGRGLRRWRCVWGLGPGRGHVGCSSVLTGGRAPGWGQGAAVGSERTRGFRVSQKAKCCSLWCPLPQTGPRVELANG